MVRIGVTGHIRLQPRSRRAVYRELLRFLRPFPAVHGVTCLAEGADRIFAEAIHACHGTFEVILPVPVPALPGAAEVAEDAALILLLAQASEVSRLTVPGPPEAAYEAASREVLLRSDILIAVWDGDERGGRGGTAATVAYARAQGKRVEVVWPRGARRARAPTGAPAH